MSPAFADSPQPPVSDVDGRTFSSADGLVREESEVSAARAHSGNAAPAAVTRYSRGTSWAATNHYLLVGYTGESLAAGNVYTSTQRVIAASFKYTRDGKDVIGWQTSRAKQSGCSWTAGDKARKSITDSLGWNDAVTKFRYSFDYIHPAAC